MASDGSAATQPRTGPRMPGRSGRGKSTTPAPEGDLLLRAASDPIDDVLANLHTTASGLDVTEAAARLGQYGRNEVAARRVTAWQVLLRQCRSPILLLLVIAAVIAGFTGDVANASIIGAILVLSVGLGFSNEYRAERAAQALHDRVHHTVVVRRGGHEHEVDVAELVPGDIVRVGLGSVVPADLRLLETTDLSCDESAVTGESLPVDKRVTLSAPPLELADLPGCLLMGTVVHSGSGVGVVVATGADAAFGRVAESLNTALPQTGFQIGLRRYSTFLLIIAIILTAFIFIANLVLQRPLLDAILFALAIAVGITPQLLPAVVSTSLAAGSRLLARDNVLVKRLTCIEDLGNVDILVTDKTGTLTEGRITFDRALAATGITEARLFESGLSCVDVDLGEAGTNAPAGLNSLDAALWEHATRTNATATFGRVATRPFDHDSRTTTVLVDEPDAGRHEILKGAPESILPACTNVADADREALDRLYADGSRVIAVASREVDATVSAIEPSPSGLTLLGYLAFLDPPKTDARPSLERLHRLGVEVKIATGDSRGVAEKVCRDLGIDPGESLEGSAIDALGDEELLDRISRTAVFARVSPAQKARIVALLRRSKTVAFLGDGVNDAPSLHSADVGISVDSAADVAKDAADIVLLDKSLASVANGIVGGRRVFNNTMKYVLMSTSSNFGNMFSAATASAVLPFLPMLPGQILLNNLLYDASQLAIPTDSVDEEALRKPAHWDLGMIRRFMLFFGPVSSIFDFLTFAILLLWLHADQDLFRTGWFVESLATQTLVVFVIRTRRIPFFRSKPSAPMLAAVLAAGAIGVLLPYTPLAPLLGFAPLPGIFLLTVVGLVVAYLVMAEGMKWLFWTKLQRAPVVEPDARASAHARALRHRTRRARRFGGRPAG